MLTPRVIAMQQYFLPLYEDLLWCIVRNGSCILQTQLCRLLFRDRRDYKLSTELVRDLVDARILSKQKLGEHNLLVVTSCTLKYFGIVNQPHLNAYRIKLSALIFEKYLTQGYWKYDNPAKALRQRMERTSALSCYAIGEAHSLQLERLLPTFEAHGFCTDGMLYQIERARLRMECAKKKRSFEAARERDLYGLACSGIYITGVAIRPDQYGNKRPVALVDVYLVNRWSVQQLVWNLIDAKRVIESTLQNDAVALFTVHSHDRADPDFMRKTWEGLARYSDYLLPEDAEQEVTFRFYDTRAALFSSIDPDNLI